MSRSMMQAAVTMNQLQNKLDMIGGNLANSQTTGYKARKADFSSLLSQQIDNMNDPANAEGRSTPDGIRVGSGARLGAVDLDLSHGAVKDTGRKLDTALLDKNHLFEIQTPETRYTRDGAFYLSPVNDGEDVMLTTENGDPVMGENGEIVFEEGFDDVTIETNGQISVERGDTTENAGKLAINDAIRPQLLEPAGESSFRMPDLAEAGYNAEEIMQPADDEGNVLRHGALEQANVDLGEQFTDMMTAQRSYQFNARTLSMGDQMMGLINQLR
ncbi:flagellar hook-basal body complex protein FlhP [Barrientosiimonas marina]|uniref:Flagellar hook-basal body protein n=1 Tax=Lentibacillus kimchii TaxID=1542911 RepID=A0ABW2UY63_9BACI